MEGSALMACRPRCCRLCSVALALLASGSQAGWGVVQPSTIYTENDVRALDPT